MSWSISASVLRTEPARCLTMTSVLRSTFWYPAGCSTMPLGFVYTPWICRTLSFLFSCAHSSTCTKRTVPETLARADSSAANKLLQGYSLLRSSASPVLGLASYLFKRWIMCCQKDNFGEASQWGSFFFMLHLISSRGHEYNSLCSGSLLHLFDLTLQLNGWCHRKRPNQYTGLNRKMGKTLNIMSACFTRLQHSFLGPSRLWEDLRKLSSWPSFQKATS